LLPAERVRTYLARTGGAQACSGSPRPAPPPARPRSAAHTSAVRRIVSDTAAVLRDPARLAALAATGLVDSPPGEVLDRLTRLAGRLLDAPIALLTLVDDRRQVFACHAGLSPDLAQARETPLEASICRIVVTTGEPLVVGEATTDPRLADHPMVALGVRAYAGYPVRAPGGHVVGSFCVCDMRPRDWDGDAQTTLRELAELASLEIEALTPGAGAERTQRILADAEGWFRSLVEQSIMGVYCYQDGRFRYVNPRLVEIFGYSREEMQAPGALQRVVHSDDLPRVAENIRARLDGEIPTVRYSLRAIRADGEILHLDVHGTRTDIDGRPALIGVAYDVTERVRAEREREAAMQARDRFYAMASHELRTPVSTVMLYNDLLLGGMYEPLTPQQYEAVERSQTSARHLLDLINDLLDLSKLEAGRLETRREEVDAEALVEEVVAELAPVAAAQGSDLHLETGGAAVTVVGDRLRIRQILLNLLSNAIKFGEGRPIEVRCALDGIGGVEIRVTDHGTGIAAGDLPRIWEDFVQLGGGDEAGTGLGLPIARRLAELLGGSLEAESTPGAGSTFRFHLPGGPQGS
jgi:PAS domain S-box-containing protein